MSLKRPTKDGFVNFMSRVGFGAGSQQDASYYQKRYHTRNRQQLEAQYRGNWIAGLAIDIIAEDMTRAGVQITSEMDANEASALYAALDYKCIWSRLRQTIKWSRLYGGAIAVMMIDGQKLSTPLRPETIGEGQFSGLSVLDRWMVQPDLTDIVFEDGAALGMPRYYDVIADPTISINRERIHYSRVIRIEGIELPHYERLAENLWGESILERIWDRLVAFDSTTEGAAQLVYKAHLRTYKMSGFREALAYGPESQKALVSQIEMTRQFQTNEGLSVMDTEDEFEAHQYSFTGLPDIILQFGQQISGALQIPLVRMFGQSPAGMNSTGESDLRTYYDNVGARQNADLSDGLTRLFDVIARSELGHPLDDSFNFEFRPLWQTGEVERANIASTMAQTVGQLEANGTLTSRQALQELRRLEKPTGAFGSITDEDIEAARDDAPAIPEPPIPSGGD